jgi:hypothetical protein
MGSIMVSLRRTSSVEHSQNVIAIRYYCWLVMHGASQHIQPLREHIHKHTEVLACGSVLLNQSAGSTDITSKP